MKFQGLHHVAIKTNDLDKTLILLRHFRIGSGRAIL